MLETFEMLSLIVQQNRMPPEFEHTKANILCNDCQAKTTVPYHFIAHRCSECDSFNTRTPSTENFPTYYQPPVGNGAANGASAPVDGVTTPAASAVAAAATAAAAAAA